MSDYLNPTPRTLDYGVDRRASGRFMNAVYAWMCAGLGLTAAVAAGVSSQPQLMAAIFKPVVLIGLIVAELALVLVISYAVNRIGANAATALFMLYAGLNGLTLSAIFVVYPLGTILGAFVACAGMFGAMSLYGYFTQRDLTRLGSFLIMGLIGLILASLVNLFLASTMLDWLLTYAGIVIFLGLTAYDTQRLKAMSMQLEDGPAANRMAVVGSLILYLDFINLFLYLLKLLGRQK